MYYPISLFKHAIADGAFFQSLNASTKVPRLSNTYYFSDEVYPPSFIDKNLVISDRQFHGEVDVVVNGDQIQFDGGKAYFVPHATLIPFEHIIISEGTFFIDDYLSANFSHVIQGRRDKFRNGHHNSRIRALVQESRFFMNHVIDFSLDEGDKNVFHWIARVLPKVKFIKKYSNLSKLPLIFSYIPTSFQLETLAIMGVTNPISIIPQRSATRFEGVVIIETPWAAVQHEILMFLRHELLIPVLSDNDGVRPSGSLYIHRESFSRSLQNRQALIDMLRTKDRFDFSNMRGVGFRDSILFLHNREQIVFEHGAIGVFIIFSAPRTRWIEVLPERVHVTSLRRTNFFYWLSLGLNLRYTDHYFPVSQFDMSGWPEFSVDFSALQLD